MRAVSQAMGRTVRNKKDYGVVVLVDHRFRRSELLGKLPDWGKKAVVWESVMDMRSSISTFFARRKDNENTNVKP